MLKARVKLLEDAEGGGADRSGDDAPIKGRRLDEGEKATKKGSNDTGEMINVLTSMDAATVLSSGVVEVPTGSGSIPTVGPPAAEVLTGSDVVLTSRLIFSTATVVTPYTRRKGKEKMIESETPNKKKIQEQMDIQMARQLEEEMEREAQRMNGQISRDAEIARIHAEEELQIMIDGLDRINETIAKYLQEYHQFAIELPIERRIELIKEVPEEVKATEEVPEDKVKEMMQLVPVEEIYVEALQVKHPIIDWKHEFDRVKDVPSLLHWCILMIPTPRHCGKDGTRGFGFGFDPITDDYKIVKISCIIYDGIGDSLVYSMKMRIWSVIALPPKFDYLELESCYIKGELHWAAYLGVPERREYYLISCNLSTHVFRKIMLSKPSRGIRKPTIVDGHLAVVSLDEDGNNFRIWVMKECDNDASWHALFKFSYKNISPFNSVMQLPTNGYYFLIDNKSKRLEVYNPNTVHEFDRVKNVSSLLHWEDIFKLSYEAIYLSQQAFPFHFSSHAFTSLVVVNSYNGILCLYARCGQNDISLWNPLIRRILMIPTPCHYGKDGTRGFGFGFDTITDDYKIVKISCINYDGIGNSLVYSMKMRIWSVIALPPKFDYLELESCYINEELHWAVYLGVPERRDYYIISCNLSTHVFRKIMLPKPSRGIKKPTIVDGHLAVVSLDEDGNNFWIWVMKECDNDASWHALFKFSYKNNSPFNSVMQLPTNGYYFLINNKSKRRILMIPTPHHYGKDCTKAFSFGFDPIIDDYKIMKISCINYDRIGDSLVYSMKTRIWSAIALPPKFDYLKLESCYINGELHWEAYL
nr:hypothetical protein [Tanacetum cinerariifolium]